MAERRDVDVRTLPETQRKDDAARRELVVQADVAILCLPDEAAAQAAAWAAEAGTRVIDTSTAHRVADGWVYGLPELQPGQRDALRHADRVANPGCYPSAFLLLVRPLIDAGVLAPDAPLSIHALSGYSGGGRALIEKWENLAFGLNSLAYEAPYALDRSHKHVPEMTVHARLETEPQFIPAVGPFRCGMRVQIPLHAGLLRGHDGAAVRDVLAERYAGEPFVTAVPEAAPVDEHGLDPRACNDTNRITLHVIPNPAGHTLLVAILDNLGKGACGVAIQNLNLMLGLPETTGLPV